MRVATWLTRAILSSSCWNSACVSSSSASIAATWAYDPAAEVSSQFSHVSHADDRGCISIPSVVTMLSTETVMLPGCVFGAAYHVEGARCKVQGITSAGA